MRNKGQQQRLISIAVVAVLVGAAIYLNDRVNNEGATKGAQSSRSQQTSSAPGAAPAAESDAAPSPYPFNTATTAPAEDETDGQPNATNTLTIGYSWTSDLLKNQDRLKKILSDAERWAAAPGRRVQVVCVDIPLDRRALPSDAAVTEGVFLNGKPAAGLSGNPGSDISPERFESFLGTVK